MPNVNVTLFWCTTAQQSNCEPFSTGLLNFQESQGHVSLLGLCKVQLPQASRALSLASSSSRYQGPDLHPVGWWLTVPGPHPKRASLRAHPRKLRPHALSSSVRAPQWWEGHWPTPSPSVCLGFLGTRREGAVQSEQEDPEVPRAGQSPGAAGRGRGAGPSARGAGAARDLAARSRARTAARWRRRGEQWRPRPPETRVPGWRCCGGCWCSGQPRAVSRLPPARDRPSPSAALPAAAPGGASGERAAGPRPGTDNGGSGLASPRRPGFPTLPWPWGRAPGRVPCRPALRTRRGAALLGVPARQLRVGCAPRTCRERGTLKSPLLSAPRPRWYRRETSTSGISDADGLSPVPRLGAAALCLTSAKPFRTNSCWPDSDEPPLRWLRQDKGSACLPRAGVGRPHTGSSVKCVFFIFSQGLLRLFSCSYNRLFFAELCSGEIGPPHPTDTVGGVWLFFMVISKQKAGVTFYIGCSQNRGIVIVYEFLNSWF